MSTIPEQPDNKFPGDPHHGDIFEFKPGLLYQWDARISSWIEIVSSSVNLSLATPIKKGSMSADDFKKLNRLVLPPPQSTIIGNDCLAPFQQGVIGFYSGDNYIDVNGNLDIRNIDEFGDVISEEHAYHIHQHTYGFDFTIDLPLLIQTLIAKDQIILEGRQGDQGLQGDDGDPGVNEIIAGQPGKKGIQGLAPECELSIDPEPVSAERRSGLKRALTKARIIDHETDDSKFILEFDRQVVGSEDASTSQFNTKNSDSFWVLAVASVSGTPQSIFYVDVEPLVETVRQKYLSEVSRIKQGYEDIVEFWVQTMSDLFDEQKAALCCSLEYCMSVRKSIDLRQHMESVAASAIGAGGAKIRLNARDSDEATEIGQTGTLARMPDGEDLCDSGDFDPGPEPIACDSGMDVCFCLDDTSSMGNYISMMKDQVSAYIETIEEKSGDDYQLGLILFKDNVTTKVSFSPNNKDSFITELDNVEASGGGNRGQFGLPEASNEAVQAAISFPWRSDGVARIIILITDAPASAGCDESGICSGECSACISTGNTARSQGIVIGAIQASIGTSTEFNKDAPRHLKGFTEPSGGVFVQSYSSDAADSINEIFSICDEEVAAAAASVLSAFSAPSSRAVIIDPLLNVATIKAAKTLELPKGRYAATIKNLNVKISGKYGAVARIQYTSGDSKKVVQFLDKGRFDHLTDAKNAYEGLSLAFDHDGGDIHIYFPILPNPDTSGSIEITIDAIGSTIQKQGLGTPVLKKKLEKKLIPINVVDVAEEVPFTCSMSTSHLFWYEKGWVSGDCCGLVVDVGGQDYIIFKRGIGDDVSCGGGESSSTPCVAKANDILGQHPAFAWPTFDGKTFSPIPSDASITFRYDDAMSQAVQQAIEKSEYSNPKGSPAGYRHLAFQLSAVLFPSS